MAQQSLDQTAAAYDQHGVQLAQRGDLPAAIEQFRTALKLDPKEPAVWYHLGLAYDQARQTDEAMAGFEEALRLQPAHVEARYMLADCCHKRGDFAGELNLLSEVVKRAPEFADAHYNYGVALKRQGKVQAAAEELRAAVRLKPADPKYLLALGVSLVEVDRKEAVRVLRDAVRYRADDADAHYNLGLALATDGQDTTAVPELKRALELNPKHAAAVRAMGVTFIHQGKFDEAVAALQRALELAANDAEAANNLGTAQLRLKNVNGAVESLEKAIHINPNLIKAHATLAQAYQRAGRAAEAQRESERVASLTAEQRNLGRAMVLVDSAVQQFSAGHAREAISTLQQAISASPGFPDAHFQLGRIVRESGGDPNEAIACFRRVLNLDPERADAHYEIGVTLELAGRKAEALPEYRIAVEMAPCHADARTALARAALEAGEWPDAQKEFRAVIALAPQNAGARKGYDQAVARQQHPQ
ncbi:MAG TPA: tetratricopeptide repeat protein [Bryobacteraceae bacterium]